MSKLISLECDEVVSVSAAKVCHDLPHLKVILLGVRIGDLMSSLIDVVGYQEILDYIPDSSIVSYQNGERNEKN